MPKYATNEEWWRSLVTGNDPALPLRQLRYVWGLLPSSPRCKFCNAPITASAHPSCACWGKPHRTEAWCDRLVGDEVIGIYVPGFAGPEHARRAVEAAREMLRATGHADPGGPWLPVGVGIHTGIAFGGATDITALGDNVNIAARLASKAEPGEVLLSEATYTAAGPGLGSLEQRQLELKGKSEPVGVRVLRVLQEGSRQ